MSLVCSAENNVCIPLKNASINGQVQFFIVAEPWRQCRYKSVDDKIPLRAAACKRQLELNRQLVGNGCSVHIERKCD